MKTTRHRLPCPSCGEQTSVTPKGLLHAHRTWEGLPRDESGIYCAGSHKEASDCFSVPMTTRPTWQEIAELRKRLGLSQVELAELIGVHALTISKWELDKLHPTRFQAALLVAFNTAVARDGTIGKRASATAMSLGIVAGLHDLLHAAYRGTEEPRKKR